MKNARALIAALAGLALASSLAVTSTATAAPRSPSPLGLTCQDKTSSDGVAYTFCTGEVPSFDGIGLDTDLTLPANVSGPVPTIVMLHGWSQDKTKWEADSVAGTAADAYHWNNVWFASQGYAVVNYTARGFEQSCGTADQDTNCPNGYTHLSDRRFETKDSQTLLGKLVDAGIADPAKLVATGDSYGGGQSWLLATSLPWKTPNGTTLQLAAAVPKYPWTDLLYSLAPNGRQTSGPQQGRPHLHPFGIPKESYIDGLLAAGRASAQGRYDENPADPGTNLDAQYAFVQAGEPYDQNPIFPTLTQSYRYRSPYDATRYFRAVFAHSLYEVPVLSIQGWTDPLFPSGETAQMVAKLKAADPNYPVYAVYADIGHSNAQNPLPQWRPINGLANGFLDSIILGNAAEAPAAQTYSFETHCPGLPGTAPDQTPLTASSMAALAAGKMIGTSGAAKTTSSADSNQADGADTDPIAHSGCLTEPSTDTSPTAALWSWHVPATGLPMVGRPRLGIHYDLTGTDATVALKLFDVAADGTRTLVTRGEYRLNTNEGDPASGELITQLYGNQWTFPAGDTLQLQITQSDSPYLRPDNLASSIAWGALTFVMPSTTTGTHRLLAA
jgi:predicted acyl esterase